MTFKPRLTQPEKNNKYYITKSNGGYSNAIKGKNSITNTCDCNLDTLPNCVGYAYGRFNEIVNQSKMVYLSPVNAENFPEYAKGLKTGKTPKLGAVVVWQKGTLKSCDGAGHVAIVEQINSDGSIITSESGYNASKSFWIQLRKNDGNWGQSSSYKFRCFIYQPEEYTLDNNTCLKVGSKGNEVKQLQINLNKILNSNLIVDGSYGSLTEEAVKNFQLIYKIKATGIFDEKTQKQITTILKELPEGLNVIELTLNKRQVKAYGKEINNSCLIRLDDLKTLGIVSAVKNKSITK